MSDTTAAADPFRDVADMHRDKFGDLPARVRSLGPDRAAEFLEFRLKFLGEEFDELAEAAETGDAAGVVDALVDVCVVAVGTLHAFGVDPAEAWRRVHAANMAKRPGVKPGRPNPFGFPDLVKPAGWQAPDHSGNTGILAEVLP